jgi:microcystin-dependent protein
MLNPFVGEILLFPFNFPPTGYAFCRGQLLPINQNQALFSLIGTFYGGDGKSSFALPNLQAKVSMGVGNGPGLTSHEFPGATGGSETTPLTTAQMPAHTHVMSASSVQPTMTCLNGAGNQQTPAGNVPATESAGVTATYTGGPADALMRNGNIALTGPASAAPAGGGQPHENRQPYLALNYCIALQGVFPPRTF